MENLLSDFGVKLVTCSWLLSATLHQQHQPEPVVPFLGECCTLN